jgi:hypothetical protein
VHNAPLEHDEAVQSRSTPSTRLPSTSTWSPSSRSLDNRESRRASGAHTATSTSILIAPTPHFIAMNRLSTQ